MEQFEKVYSTLNTAQKKAVDAIDGPVLVVAGPGTGKTQLLSARVAQILRVTDTIPQNILCLTFTESGAQNMRERLIQFIGKDAYDVQMSTYHAFGGDIIRRYPEYFNDTHLERPIDELGKRQILTSIIDRLNYRSALKQARYHIGDLMGTVSEVKRGLLTPKALRNIATDNVGVVEAASQFITQVLAAHTKRLPSKITIAEPLFTQIHDRLQSLAESTNIVPPFENLAQLAAEQLKVALSDAAEIGKTKPLTAWKNSWLVKNANNQFILTGALEAARIRELATVIEAYEAALTERGLYDFDDMILHAIRVLEENTDLKYTLQERYQYILLDEFQDTNAAQLRLVELLTDNPANEGRPNVLAVGDDDQAIYAFQGAQYSNMLDYFHLFRDVLVINLSENYRTTEDILYTAQHVSAQITDTLSASFSQLKKELVAANTTLPSTILQHTEYVSEIAERAGIASDIRSLIINGISPSDIAILAPKHRYLEPLVPYLEGIPLRYERRENILQAPIVKQLITMSKLVIALHERNFALAESYWPEVLSYDFWNFPVSSIWKLSWEASREHRRWSEILLDNETFRGAALLFLSLATQVETETLEVMLDRLTGTEEVQTGEKDFPIIRSPLRAQLLVDGGDAQLYQTVTELTVLRARLHEHQVQQGSALGLRDLIHFVAEYEAAEEQMINTSPYSEAADAVQLMTVFKAKGLEFSHVFLVSCQDNVWGNAARGNGNKLTLPANLAPIRHAGTTEDERLRIFFVAMTRARYGLHLSSHTNTYAGKKPPRLKYLIEIEQDDGRVTSQILPVSYATVLQDSSVSPSLGALETNWKNRHWTFTTPLRELMRERLDIYRLSPTHLTSFLDLDHAGPQTFMLNTLLRFPSAPSIDIAFGNAIHETMEWLQIQMNIHGALPILSHTIEYFYARIELQSITPEQIAVQQARGKTALETFLADAATQFTSGNLPEYNFRDEGVVWKNGVRLGGKIDLLEINQDQKTINVIDYKTGSLGNNPAKRHRYELQLYCYKLLLEGSHTFKDYQVQRGCLVFIEPNAEGQIQRLSIDFRDGMLNQTRELLSAMWRHVQNLDMPDISTYGTGLSAIKQFETDLIAENE